MFLITALFQELLKEKYEKADAQILRRHNLAIAEAIRSGGGYLVAKFLTAKSIHTIPKPRIYNLRVIIKELTNNANIILPKYPKIYQELAEWILPILDEFPEDLILILDNLTSADNQLESLFIQALSKKIFNFPQAKIWDIFKSLKNIPGVFEPYLKSNLNIKESRLALVKCYHYQAIHQNSELALNSLFRLCLDDSRDVSLDAAGVILELTKEVTLKTSDVTAIIENSRIPGVRNKCLEALINMVALGSSISDENIIYVSDLLCNENSPEILRPLYKLIERWVDKNDYISDSLATITFNLTHRLVSQCSSSRVDAAIANPAFVTLKNIANLEYSDLTPKLGKCGRHLLHHTDVRTINCTFVIGFLDKIAKFDVVFLSQILHEDVMPNLDTLPIANLDAFVVATIHNEGRQSPLLDEMLADERLPEVIRSQILREREKLI